MATIFTELEAAKKAAKALEDAESGEDKEAIKAATRTMSEIVSRMAQITRNSRVAEYALELTLVIDELEALRRRDK